jgi:hypothetical protein
MHRSTKGDKYYPAAISIAYKKTKRGPRQKGAAKFKTEHNSANTDQIKLLGIDMKISLNFKKICKFTFSKKIIFLTKNWHLFKIAFFFSITEFPSETDTIRFK